MNKIYFYENGSWATCPQKIDGKCWEIEEDSFLFNKILNSNESLKPVIENDELIDVIIDQEIINKNEIQRTIELLKKELSNGDYKIIKCYEAKLKNEEVPYDIDSLINSRDELRYQINVLESQL